MWKTCWLYTTTSLTLLPAEQRLSLVNSFKVGHRQLEVWICDLMWPKRKYGMVWWFLSYCNSVSTLANVFTATLLANVSYTARDEEEEQQLYSNCRDEEEEPVVRMSGGLHNAEARPYTWPSMMRKLLSIMGILSVIFDFMRDWAALIGMNGGPRNWLYPISINTSMVPDQ